MKSICRLLVQTQIARRRAGHLFHSVNLNAYTSYSGTKTTQDCVPSRSSVSQPKPPIEIPYQAKVSNRVHLIGYIEKPVQVQTDPDGNPMSTTIISRRSVSSPSTHLPFYFPPPWIPIVFEGDMAYVAACHLKEKDIVYISGQLREALPIVHTDQGRSYVQILVQNLNFIQKPSERKTKAFGTSERN